MLIEIHNCMWPMNLSLSHTHTQRHMNTHLQKKTISAPTAHVCCTPYAQDQLPLLAIDTQFIYWLSICIFMCHYCSEKRENPAHKERELAFLTQKSFLRWFMDFSLVITLLWFHFSVMWIFLWIAGMIERLREPGGLVAEDKALNVQ